jgi:cleavage and polyadenylation specificity factor subunit 3
MSSETELTLEWIASASNDMVADSLIVLLMGIEQSPASVKCERVTHRIGMTSHSLEVTTHAHSHSDEKESLPLVQESDWTKGPHPHGAKHGGGHFEGEAAVLRLERIIVFLEAHFGDVELYEPKPDDEAVPAILVKLDENEARIGLLDMVCCLVL